MNFSGNLDEDDSQTSSSSNHEDENTEGIKQDEENQNENQLDSPERKRAFDNVSKEEEDESSPTPKKQPKSRKKSASGGKKHRTNTRYVSEFYWPSEDAWVTQGELISLIKGLENSYKELNHAISDLEENLKGTSYFGLTSPVYSWAQNINQIQQRLQKYSNQIAPPIKDSDNEQILDQLTNV